MNFKLFFRLCTWSTQQVFGLYFRRFLDNELFWISVKSTFLAFKKSCTSCPNWGEGGGNSDKIQKNSSFFRDAFPYSDKLQSAQILIRRVEQKFALIGLWAFLLISGLYPIQDSIVESIVNAPLSANCQGWIFKK